MMKTSTLQLLTDFSRIYDQLTTPETEEEYKSRKALLSDLKSTFKSQLRLDPENEAASIMIDLLEIGLTEYRADMFIPEYDGDPSKLAKLEDEMENFYSREYVKSNVVAINDVFSEIMAKELSRKSDK